MTDTLQPTAGGEDIERMLIDRDVEFHKTVISFAQIDHEASRHNQARFLPIHEDLVLNYAAAMDQGDVFPPIVVNTKGKTFVVLDGNHRVAAAELVGYQTTTAYVITKISNAAAELFTFEANARHGMTTTLAERIQQGIYLVNMGNQPKAVARALAVPERKLYDALQSNRATARLSKVGINPDDIPALSVRRRLDSISSNVVLRPAAELVIKAKLATEDVNDLIVEINKAESETKALAVVTEARNRMAPRIRSTSGGRLEMPKNVNRVLIAYRILKNLDTNTLPGEIDRLDEEMAKSIRRDLFQLIGTLVTASEALGHGS